MQTTSSGASGASSGPVRQLRTQAPAEVDAVTDTNETGKGLSVVHLIVIIVCVTVALIVVCAMYKVCSKLRQDSVDLDSYFVQSQHAALSHARREQGSLQLNVDNLSPAAKILKEAQGNGQARGDSDAVRSMCDRVASVRARLLNVPCAAFGWRLANLMCCPPSIVCRRRSPSPKHARCALRCAVCVCVCVCVYATPPEQRPFGRRPANDAALCGAAKQN